MYTLPTRTVRVISQIGEGGYSFVYLVKDTRSGERFALKVIRITESEQLKAANNEISIHRMLNDKHVMPLLDTATQTGNRAGVKEVLLLFPFISRGNLAKERTEMLKTGKCYPEDTVLQIFLGICKGLDQFHSNDPPFCHNDLKMENVMLSEQGEPILTDFGSASAAVYSISNRKEALEVQEWAEANCTMYCFVSDSVSNSVIGRIVLQSCLMCLVNPSSPRKQTFGYHWFLFCHLTMYRV